jgi:hypothetical protein
MLFAAADTQNLNAFTYNNESADLLLVFRRDPQNDIVFNLGSVSNYLNKANGTVLTVTNFRLAAVTANYGANLSGVSVSLFAVTTAADPLRRAWVTDPDAATVRDDIAGSRHGLIRSKVDAIGQFPEAATFDSQTNEYIIARAESTSPTYVMSSAGSQDPTTLSGAVLFGVEGTVPATLRFFELQVSALTPKPAAPQVGSFSITAAGALTFTAGSGVSGPSITSQPTNVTVFAGGVAGFNVIATGAPLTYQWQFNAADISGATASGYSLAAHTTNVGNYRVIVANGAGSVTSSVATLTVNLPGAANLGGFGKVAGGAFSLNLTGTSGAYYEIQSNTNLNSSNAWATIAFITNNGGKTIFGDASASNAPQKFYRAVAR